MSARIPHPVESALLAQALSAEPDWTLTVAQFRYLEARAAIIEAWQQSATSDTGVLDAITNTAAFLVLFRDIGFDAAWDRYGGVCETVERIIHASSSALTPGVPRS